MKFSGSGSLPFKQLGKYLKKKEKKILKKEVEEKIQNRIVEENLAAELIKEFYNPVKSEDKEVIKKRLEVKRDFSLWEQNVYKKLIESQIKFEKRFRKFPIRISENITVNYEPDFFLEEYEIDGKEVIIEAHEELTSDDVVKYSTFMKRYFPVFHLIMIVNENELREWNNFNESNRLFNDIWIIHDLEDLISWIKRQNTKTQDFNQETKCPHCPTIAVGINQIDNFFGFRKKKNGEKYPQSLCRECRSLQSKLGTKGLMDFLKQSKQELSAEVERFCTGCNNYFKTKIPDESFCDKCNKKYWNQ